MQTVLYDRDMDIAERVPNEINLGNLTQSDFPRMAKDKNLMEKIRTSIRGVPTKQTVVHGDSRKMNLKDKIHLVVTSPPYWTLKKYEPIEGQLATIKDYEQFLAELDKVWEHCFRALVAGGRMVVVVGDVCLSRRAHGHHHVMPLHSSIQEHCRRIGFENLTPVIWYKIANITLEVEGGRFLGKPYEPNAVVKNDVEYILFFRKPGKYRSPSVGQRVLSLIPEEEHRVFFQQIWNLPGASTKRHPAPFPLPLAERLVRMFSFVGDTVLDPFLGTGTVLLAAGLWGRNGVGYEIDSRYVKMSLERLSGDIKLNNVNLVEEVK